MTTPVVPLLPPPGDSLTPPPPQPPPAPAPAPAPVGERGDDTGRLLRPYAITGGRTSAPSSLTLESQLRRSDLVKTSSQRWEAARIVEMAARPIALVEVAARTHLPVGVAKVVVADLIDQGVLTTGQRPPDSSFSSLLERVLDGLDRL